MNEKQNYLKYIVYKITKDDEEINEEEITDEDICPLRSDA